MKFDDEGGEGLTTHQDDEYRWAGVTDPKIMVTTSRDPSSRLKQFAKEIKLLLPNAQRLNRGGYEVQELVKACVATFQTWVPCQRRIPTWCSTISRRSWVSAPC